MTDLLARTIARIGPLDQSAMRAAEARQLQLTKPPRALGRLESLSVQLAGITASERPRLTDKVVAVMAADHGVVAEGVSAFPAEVTPAMVMNFVAGGAAINVLSRHVGARVIGHRRGRQRRPRCRRRHPPQEGPPGHREHGARPRDEP